MVRGEGCSVHRSGKVPCGELWCLGQPRSTTLPRRRTSKEETNARAPTQEYGSASQSSRCDPQQRYEPAEQGAEASHLGPECLKALLDRRRPLPPASHATRRQSSPSRFLTRRRERRGTYGRRLKQCRRDDEECQLRHPLAPVLDSYRGASIKTPKKSGKRPANLFPSVE